MVRRAFRLIMKMLVIERSKVNLTKGCAKQPPTSTLTGIPDMPHVIVEYSANIEDKIRVPQLLAALHEAVVQTEIAELAGLRTRAERREDFRIADNHPSNGFVAIIVRIAQGRTLETRKMLLEAMTATANKHLEPVFAAAPLALSIEVQEIDPVLRVNRSNIREWMKTRENAA
jgi:5-carboxymethyl-2-hydroxymuconate isomerase